MAERRNRSGSGERRSAATQGDDRKEGTSVEETSGDVRVLANTEICGKFGRREYENDREFSHKIFCVADGRVGVGGKQAQRTLCLLCHHVQKSATAHEATKRSDAQKNRRQEGKLNVFL